MPGSGRMKTPAKPKAKRKPHPWRNPDGLRSDPHNGRHPALPNWQGRMIRR